MMRNIVVRAGTILAGGLVAGILLSGCTASTVAVVRAVSTAEACGSVAREVHPAELAAKPALAPPITDYPAFETAVASLSTVIHKAAGSTKNVVVATKTRAVATEMLDLVTETKALRSTKSAADIAAVTASSRALASADKAFAKVCHFEL